MNQLALTLMTPEWFCNAGNQFPGLIMSFLEVWSPEKDDAPVKILVLLKVDNDPGVKASSL